MIPALASNRQPKRPNLCSLSQTISFHCLDDVHLPDILFVSCTGLFGLLGFALPTFAEHPACIASFCFYGWWDYRFAGLLFGASIIDYGIAIGLSRTDQPGPRRWLLASGITVNLSLLSFFKYFNFFADSAVTLPNTVRKGGCDKWIFSVCSIPNQIGMTPSSSHYSSEQTTSAA